MIRIVHIPIITKVKATEIILNADVGRNTIILVKINFNPKSDPYEVANLSIFGKLRLRVDVERERICVGVIFNESPTI